MLDSIRDTSSHPSFFHLCETWSKLKILFLSHSTTLSTLYHPLNIESYFGVNYYELFKTCFSPRWRSVQSLSNWAMKVLFDHDALVLSLKLLFVSLLHFSSFCDAQLLGWMHCKLMQNSIESLKNPIIGNFPWCLMN